ncbi:MAG: hypothetical protein ACE5FF_06780 [Saprospiraceae bacterium]
MQLTYSEKKRLAQLEEQMGIPRWKYLLRIGGIYTICFFVGYTGLSWMEKEAAFSLRNILSHAGQAIFTGLAVASVMWIFNRKEYKNLLRKKGDEKWKTLT